MRVLNRTKRLIKTISNDPRLFLLLVTGFLLLSLPLTVYVANTVNDLRTRAQSAIANIKANGSDGPITVSSGSNVTVSWTVTYYDKCAVQKNGVTIWSQTGSNLSSSIVQNVTTNTVFRLYCNLSSDPDIDETDTVTVNVSTTPPPPPPTATVNIKAAPPGGSASDGPITIAYNTAASLSWTSSNASSCTASGSWSGTKGISSSGTTTGNLTSSPNTYTLVCRNSAGTFGPADSVTVNVSSAPTPPTPPNGGGTPPTPPGGGGSPPIPPGSSTGSRPPGSGSRPPNGSSGTSGSPPSSAPTLSFKVVTGTNSFLVGSKEVVITVEGTNVYKKVVVGRNSTEVTVTGNDIIAGNSYTLKVRGDWILTQKIPFVFSQGMSINLAGLKIGDLNADEKITSTDVFDFLNGFVADKFYDLNSDGVVNSIDYAILVGNIQ